MHKGVRDIRSDHHGMLIHMYSILALRTRVPTSSLAMTGTTGDLKSTKANSFLPNKDDVHKVKMNLTVLVSDILCTYIKCLQPLAKYAPQHIPQKYYSQMSEVSETCFLDVLLKNEASHTDMIDIMVAMQGYIGDQEGKARVLSGGDQLTCEWQADAQHHVMDANTQEERLQLLEPVCEEWHALMCFMKVSIRQHVTEKCL